MKKATVKKEENKSPAGNTNQGKKTVQVKSFVPPDSGINFTIQKKENKTGLPDNLKSGLENMSGMDLSDVKVHYNSSQPAQLNAHAYAQGNQIHVAPGQEKHLPHEGWHVVQQKQGRVKPTVQLKSSVAVNDDPALEKEADAMGAKAVQLKKRVHPDSIATETQLKTIQLAPKPKGTAKPHSAAAGSAAGAAGGAAKASVAKNNDDKKAGDKKSEFLVVIKWSCRQKDIAKIEAYKGLMENLNNPKNYDPKTGEPGFLKAHVDDTGQAQWKLQADRETMGAGSKDRLHINVIVSGSTFNVEIVALSLNTH